MVADIKCETNVENIHTLCGVDDAKVLIVITNYSDDDNAGEKTLKIDYDKKGKFEVYLLDEEHDSDLVKTTEELEATMKNNSCVMIKEI